MKATYDALARRIWYPIVDAWDYLVIHIGPTIVVMLAVIGLLSLASIAW